ncbi:hypothetical protein ABK905_09870 [Acerihabitans sp. KWT182]|uniref:Calcineurin-like phosphoesterase domain-containing protein n=1 Tax=Acerihabitans sp. KWT182 TaxID=3157919 RepID=A0AAU7QDL3_9GAMM
MIEDKDIYCKDWVLLNVDTVQSGKDSGLFTYDDKIAIEKKIHKLTGKKIGLFMHHHPIAVGIPLVDNCMLMNSRALFDLIDANDHIRSLVCGHAHTYFTEIYNDCVVDVCPATCFQWKPGARTVQTLNKRGYKVLEFSEKFHSETFYS